MPGGSAPPLIERRGASPPRPPHGAMPMPVLVDKLPFAETRRAARADGGLGRAAGGSGDHGEVITIGLINNMPDAALEGTARQLFTLLHDAAADRVVHLKLFALPGVPRG